MESTVYQGRRPTAWEKVDLMAIGPQSALQMNGPIVRKMAGGTRWILAVVFLYAAIKKLQNPAGFHEDVLNFGWVGDPMAAGVAVGLPALELICALALLLPRWRRSAGLVISAMLVVFLAGICRAWWLGIELHCGCFGASMASVNYPWKIAEDVMLLVISSMQVAYLK